MRVPAPSLTTIQVAFRARELTSTKDLSAMSAPTLTTVAAADEALLHLDEAREIRADRRVRSPEPQESVED